MGEENPKNHVAVYDASAVIAYEAAEIADRRANRAPVRSSAPANEMADR
jgi:hypothetical protein